MSSGPGGHARIASTGGHAGEATGDIDRLRDGIRGGGNPAGGTGARRPRGRSGRSGARSHQGRRRADRRPRQGARRQPRGRLARSRGDGVSASELRRLAGAALPRPLPPPRLRRTPGHVHRAPREPRRESGPAGAAAGVQRVHRRHAERVHAAQGQHVFELADHRRLGALRRRGPRGLHGQPLSHAGDAHEPRARRPLDGRLRRAADRHEAAGRVLGAVSHELVLSDRQPQSPARRASRPRRRSPPASRRRPPPARPASGRRSASPRRPPGRRTRRTRRCFSICR